MQSKKSWAGGKRLDSTAAWEVKRAVPDDGLDAEDEESREFKLTPRFQTWEKIPNFP